MNLLLLCGANGEQDDEHECCPLPGGAGGFDLLRGPD